jgi:hypothetical protein
MIFSVHCANDGQRRLMTANEGAHDPPPPVYSPTTRPRVPPPILDPHHAFTTPNTRLVGEHE